MKNPLLLSLFLATSVAFSIGYSKQGGQPGNITLNGAIVADNDKLDSRVSVSHTAGLNYKDQREHITTKDLLILNSLEKDKNQTRTVDLKSLEQSRTYLNLGCQLTESETAGLKEVEPYLVENDIILASASRIFVCGSVKLNSIIPISLWASEIMLKNADFTKIGGSLSLNTNTLVLIEKNKITTSSKDELSFVRSAGDMQIFVGTEIYGDGELNLNSRGGNCTFGK